MIAYLIDYDPDEASILSFVLQRAGFSVRSARDLERVVQSWPDQPGGLVLVASRRSVLTAQLCAHLSQARSVCEAPILLISDPIDEESHIQLLEAGADLVVTRPFSARMLIVQLRVLVRRFRSMPLFSPSVVEVKDYQLDTATHTLNWRQQPPVHLTPLEFRLLHALMTHPGKVLPTENLVEHVWGYDGQGNRGLVRGLIKRLREKLETNPHDPVVIRTVAGLGYVFQA